MEIKDHLGNIDLLKLRKTAYLCSREIPASLILKCYDWAIEQKDKGNCIISGFHSKIEKDVFHYLLSGTQPVIMVLARGMKEKIEPEIIPAVEAKRLLIITPFEHSIKRVTKDTSETRNRFMIDLADEIVIGYAAKDGNLAKLVSEFENKIFKNIK